MRFASPEQGTKDPRIAFDSNGNAIAIWKQHDGTQYNMWSRRFDGNNWAVAETISRTTSVGAVHDLAGTEVVFGPNDNAISVWTQDNLTEWVIWTNWHDGSGWGTAQERIGAGTSFAHDVQIAFDAAGNAVAVFCEEEGSVWARRFDGSQWGPRTAIESGDGIAASPQIAIDRDGNAIAVWEQYDGEQYDVWSNRFDGSDWGTAETLESGTGSARAPRIAVDSTGNAIAVWHQPDDTREAIWANRFNGSEWGAAEIIDSGMGAENEAPKIAFAPSGHAIAVWEQKTGTLYSIWSNRFDGNNWGTAEDIRTEISNADGPWLAADTHGNAIAVWRQHNGIGWGIQANRFDGSSWGEAQAIDAEAGNSEDPRVAFDPDGNAIAIWTQQDTANRYVWTARFELQP